MMSQLTPPYPLIYDGLCEGQVIPFLGSGASLGGREKDAKWEEGVATYLPTASELADYLADKTVFPKGEPRDLAKVAQYSNAVGGRNWLDQKLYNIFKVNYQLTSLHNFLAGLPSPLLIVTTNYDDLIERAFEIKKRAYDLVIHTTHPDYSGNLLWWPHGKRKPREAVPNELDIDLSAVAVIYKMHGAVDRRDPARSQYVITEDDYIDFLTRMTSDSAIPAIFSQAFQQRPFLFLGYGLRDWNLRVVLNKIEKDMQRPGDITSWAIQHDPSPLERLFWQKRDVQVYDMTIEEFVAKLL